MGLDFTFFNQLDPRVFIIVAASLIGLFSVLVLFFFIKIFFWFYLPIKQKKFIDSYDYILLAIDVPKENYQSPKAVESIFTTLSGAYSGPTKKEIYFEGRVQLPFSFEIVSIEGYIQFLVRTPAIFRDLVEAAVFSQYPNANIIEVEDYVNSIPVEFPDENYNLWGAEIYPIKKDVYPIKTYPMFEHALSQELKDPMSALLETMSRLGPGEQSWVQIVITPTMEDWQARATAEVKKLIGEKVKKGKTIGEIITDPILNLFDMAADTLVIQSEKESRATGYEQINKMQNLTPGEKNIITAIQNKMSKVAFLTKIRFIYSGRKEYYSLARGVSGFFGSFSQFNSLDLNGFKPHKRNKTTASYFFVKRRLAKKQNRLLREYRERIGVVGGISRPFIMNIEELATIWHFPDIQVKAPLVKKTESKRAEPPVELPSQVVAEVESFIEPTFGTNQQIDKFTESVSPADPSEVKDDFKLDLESTYFEERFAKNKELLQERLAREKNKQNQFDQAKQANQKSGSAPDNLPL